MSKTYGYFMDTSKHINMLDDIGIICVFYYVRMFDICNTLAYRYFNAKRHSSKVDITFEWVVK